MAELPFVDSAAHYDSNTYQGKWTSITGGSGAIMGINRTGGRSGINGSLDSSSGSGAFLTLIGSYNSIYVGFAYRVTAFTTNAPCQIGSNAASGSPQVTVNPNGDGTMHLTAIRVSGNSNNSARFGINGRPFSTGVWYYIEVSAVCNNNTLLASVRVNGNLTINNLTVSDNFTNNTNFFQVNFGQSGGGTPSNICDIYINNNGFYGDVVIGLSKPNGNGFYSQWAPSNNNLADWQITNQVPPTANNTFVFANNNNLSDSYTMQPVPTAATLFAVQGLQWAAKDQPSNAAFQTLFRSNNTDFLGTTFFPSYNSFAFGRDSYNNSVFTNNAWTAAEYNAMQYGQKRTV